jgi:hypothetical protein
MNTSAPVIDRMKHLAAAGHHGDVAIDLRAPRPIVEDRLAEHDRSDPARDDPRPERAGHCGSRRSRARATRRPSRSRPR